MLFQSKKARSGGRLSAHRLAEWLTWNWWRLRWEPSHQNARRDQRIGWRQAHELASIGGGWLWPNVTITCDGVRVVLDARPSAEVWTEPLRYVTSRRVVVPAEAFEAVLAKNGLEDWEDVRDPGVGLPARSA